MVIPPLSFYDFSSFLFSLKGPIKNLLLGIGLSIRFRESSIRSERLRDPVLIKDKTVNVKPFKGSPLDGKMPRMDHY